mmetsp:Transcript_23095/g.59335  ORF Transcript_23095/g.59335 Transcript_23095/m.59335 type:complete len:234 (+) Transcript_23095:40-741(+)
MHAPILLLLLVRILRRATHQLVSDRVQEDTRDRDGRADLLLERERLAEGDCDADDDDNTLGGVRDGLCDGPSVFDRHGRQLVVPVEGEAGHEDVVRERLVCLQQLEEGRQMGAFHDEGDRDEHDEAEDLRKRKLVADATNTLLEPRLCHEPRVLGALERRRDVGKGAGNHGNNLEIDLVIAVLVGLEARDSDAEHNDWQHHSLCKRRWLAVENRVHQRSEDRLGRLDDLTKSD